MDERSSRTERRKTMRLGHVMRGTEGRPQMRKSVLVLTAALLTVGAIGIGMLPLAAQEAPPPIATEFLTPRSVFPDDVDMRIKVRAKDGSNEVVKVADPSRTVTARFTIQPGARFPWHSHAGPVIVNVTQGTLVFVETDCGERAYPTGTAFVDLGHGHVHSAYNPTDGETVIVATFFEAPAAGSLLIPADTPACAA
jgi:quercetin dioxygenase-like cupin family protein